jgi:hypothetical protein
MRKYFLASKGDWHCIPLSVLLNQKLALDFQTENQRIIKVSVGQEESANNRE